MNTGYKISRTNLVEGLLCLLCTQEGSICGFGGYIEQGSGGRVVCRDWHVRTISCETGSHEGTPPNRVWVGTRVGGSVCCTLLLWALESTSWPTTHRSVAPEQVRRSQELLICLSCHLTLLSPWHH